MSLNNLVKRLQDIMRNDAGINGDAQRIEQMVWILFLKVYDAKEEIWEFYDENYTSIIPEELRWRNWAVDHKDGKALTGDALLDFVNGKLFPTLKAIAIDENTPMSQIIVRTAFEDNNNYMKDGILLRQVINVIDEIDFEEYEDRHAFGEIYETILRSLQSAGNSGEFYTPRAVTDFMVQMIKPKLGESIADFACGTGGFLTSALKVLDAQVQTVEDRTVYSNSIYGIEKKALPFLLCATNMLLHDIDNPRIIHGNSLEKNVREYKESDRFDVILMNPPYGGNEKEGVKQNFPADLRSSETADLFMSVIMYRLKQNGRCAIILPDGFLFGTDNAKMAIKEKLLSEFNLHIAKAVAYLGTEPIAASGDLAFWTRHGMNPLFLSYIMASPYIIARKVALATGDIIVHISGDKLGTILLPVPPLAEQERIVACIQEAELVIENYAIKVTALQKLQDSFPEALKKSILQEAVQGKLVPQDPSDEPAEALLERIRAEKQRLIKEGKIKKDKHESVIFRRDNSHYEKLDGVERCIDDEPPFEIPENWCWVRFGTALVNRDAERIPLSVSQREKLDKKYDYYGASGVIDKVDRYLFDKPLLLVGEDGANLLLRSKPIAFIASGQYWVNNHAHVIDAVAGVDLRYIALFINATNLAPYVTGTAQPKMNQEKLNSILVPLPPTNEQRRIVSAFEGIAAIIQQS